MSSPERVSNASGQRLVQHTMKKSLRVQGHANRHANGNKGGHRSGLRNENGDSDKKQGGSENKPEEEEEAEHRGGYRPKLRHFTWQFFTICMATSGIANVLWNIPEVYRFHGLYALGVIFTLLDIVLFVLIVMGISLRFFYWPGSFRKSLLDAEESQFVAAALIDVGTILLNITQYAVRTGKVGDWIVRTMNILFWIYLGATLIFAVSFYLLWWSKEEHTFETMTPLWIFPAYPLMFNGPFAAALTAMTTTKPNNMSLDIIIGGFLMQTLGYSISFMLYAIYFYRLMSTELPLPSKRPAMFISVGPSGFTSQAFILLGRNFQQVIPVGFMGNELLTGQITKVLANWMGFWIWGIAIFWCLVSTGAHLEYIFRNRLKFALAWYSFIFPNTALTTATFAVSTAFNHNTGFAILGCVFVCILVVIWLVVFGLTLVELGAGRLLTPPLDVAKSGGRKSAKSWRINKRRPDK